MRALARTRRGPDFLARLARQLRRTPSPAEAALWSRLKNRQVGGLRFKRQHIVGRHVVDFYCPRLRLVVDVTAVPGRLLDEIRDEALLACGYRVLRVTPGEIEHDAGAIVGKITALARADELWPSTPRA